MRQGCLGGRGVFVGLLCKQVPRPKHTAYTSRRRPCCSDRTSAHPGMKTITTAPAMRSDRSAVEGKGRLPHLCISNYFLAEVHDVHN
jgi:hypothetical protein